MQNQTNQLSIGVKVIKGHLSTMPSKPGVYRMLDASQVVLYVGKAKNLVKRVANYTHPERLPYRTQNVIAQTASMEIVTTSTEAEALLLEANLIKRFKPKYNILLKDDKSYPYILLTGDHVYSRIVKHRGTQKPKGSYFGPFASAKAVNTAIHDLQKAFLIRPCTDSFFSNRKRPCMEYQIKRCSAPCVNKISHDDYNSLVKQAKLFLSGKTRIVQNQLNAAMQQASDIQDYEKAANFRDRIKALNHIQSRQIFSTNSINDADVIGLYRNENSCCIQIFFFRGGQNFGNKAVFPSHTIDSSDSDILTRFISHFYQKNPPPPCIIIGHNIDDPGLLEKALSSLANHTVKLTHPNRGDKYKIIETVIANAKSALINQQAKTIKQHQLLKGVANLFGLEKAPSRVEVYDNSHVMGSNEVGVMIVAGKDGFEKKAYRRFSIKGNDRGKGDDYAMLKEVLNRRLRHLTKNTSDESSNIWPDLMLIDGGENHLRIATNTLLSLKLPNNIPLACIAKGPHRNAGRETFYLNGRNPFTLPHNDPILHYLQILRDEAHNFAIRSHRTKRKNTTLKSALDEIAGIGPTRKKTLLHHFGSVDAVQNATVEELQKANGISSQIAKDIFDFFH